MIFPELAHVQAADRRAHLCLRFSVRLGIAGSLIVWPGPSRAASKRTHNPNTDTLNVSLLAEVSRPPKTVTLGLALPCAAERKELATKQHEADPTRLP
jgi:hypothetical protein